MRKILLAVVATATLATSAIGPASALSLQPQPIGNAAPGISAPVVPVAEGCGWGRWRGPWGGCRDTPYSGPLPGGGYRPPPGVPVGNGCPPGYWHGPWGHCRDTIYHGPLPGGGWK